MAISAQWEIAGDRGAARGARAGRGGAHLLPDAARDARVLATALLDVADACQAPREPIKTQALCHVCDGLSWSVSNLTVTVPLTSHMILS